MKSIPRDTIALSFVLLFTAGCLLCAALAPAAERKAVEDGPSPVPTQAVPAKGSKITASTLDWDADTVTAIGYVVLVMEKARLQADSVVYNRATGEITALGNVVLEEASQRVTGERLVYNEQTATGVLYDAWGVTNEEVWFHGRTLEKIGENKYIIRNGSLTACNQPTPYWDFKVSKAKVVVDKHVRLTNMRLRLLKVPIFYTPFFQYPIVRDRKTGLLFPSFGTNNQRGFYLAESFFWALSRSMDATFSWERYSKFGTGLGGEFRYVYSNATRGSFSTYHFFEKERNARQARYNYDHKHDLPWGFNAAARIDFSTDFTFDQRFDRDVLTSTRRVVRSYGYVNRSWKQYGFSFNVDQNRYYDGKKEQIQTQFPNLNFSIRSLKLGPTPLYFSLGSSSNFISQHPKGEEGLSYERHDMAAWLSMPITTFPWLSVTPVLTTQETYYTKSLAPDPANPKRTIISDDPVRRDYLQARVDVEGPKIYRIFYGSEKGYSDKYKNVIIPSMSYVYTPEIKEADSVIRFDRVDRLSQLNEVSFRVVNQWMARRVVSGTQPSPYVFLTMGLEQRFSLDEDLSASSGKSGSSGNRTPVAFRTRAPLLSWVTFRPGDKLDVKSQLRWDTQFGGLLDMTVNGTAHLDRMRLQVNWFRASKILQQDRASHSLNSAVDFVIVPDMLNTAFDFNYNIHDSALQYLRTRVNLRNQCCGLSVEYLRSQLPNRDDDEFRFNFSLKNIGSFFNFNGPGPR